MLARAADKSSRLTIGVDMALMIFDLHWLWGMRSRNPKVREPKIQNKSARV